MGAVYEARERATGERLAVKVLRARLSDEAARFEREAAILAASPHPRIVRFVARGVLARGEPWLVMEWLEGEDLRRRLRRGPLGVAEGLRLLRAAAEALSALHARGVVHRDVKPENLFLQGGRIEGLKLLDLGVAQLAGASRLTDTGLVVGTPGYMAPEQARSGGPLDARADVFSLGAVLFECVTGQPAFKGSHGLGMIARMLYDETPRLGELVPGVPEGLDALVARMLAKDPEARPRDGRALTEALAPAWSSGEGKEAPARRRDCLGEGERRAVVKPEAPTERPRLLLGKPTPYVDRDHELAMFEHIFEQCVEDGLAHGVLVVAPPGMGKTRFAYEATRALRARGGPISIWKARADPLRQSTAFELLGQALQHVQRGGARLEELHEALRAPLLADRIKEAWLSFVLAECAFSPVLLVLDDLQWSDRRTVDLVDAALRECRGAPLCVLALARPEVHDTFPGLWSSRRLHELRLRKLGPRARRALVRHVLGDVVTEATAARLAALSEGNAFYLEELIRAAVEGPPNTLPETVVAMVQSRLGQLDGAARRVLRAASIFGETFWAGGVSYLLGPSHPHQGTAVREVLARLRDGEFVAASREDRFPGEEALRFRHALLREGAYSMLTEEDRALGHRLAGEWLEKRGGEGGAG
nr:serine/threonine-protein kinase [Polyangium spumosum]